MRVGLLLEPVGGAWCDGFRAQLGDPRNPLVPLVPPGMFGTFGADLCNLQDKLASYNPIQPLHQVVIVVQLSVFVPEAAV